jgi:hypothetical protein
VVVVVSMDAGVSNSSATTAVIGVMGMVVPMAAAAAAAALKRLTQRGGCKRVLGNMRVGYVGRERRVRSSIRRGHGLEHA